MHTYRSKSLCLHQNTKSSHYNIYPNNRVNNVSPAGVKPLPNAGVGVILQKQILCQQHRKLFLSKILMPFKT